MGTCDDEQGVGRRHRLIWQLSGTLHHLTSDCLNLHYEFDESNFFVLFPRPVRIVVQKEGNGVICSILGISIH